MSGQTPHFILLTKLTSDGVKTIKNNPQRIREVNSEMEQIGLKVHHQWATLVTSTAASPCFTRLLRSWAAQPDYRPRALEWRSERLALGREN